MGRQTIHLNVKVAIGQSLEDAVHAQLAHDLDVSVETLPEIEGMSLSPVGITQQDEAVYYAVVHIKH